MTDEAIASLAGYELQAEKAIAEAVVAHYSAEPQFIWVSDDEPNRQARDVLAVLADAESHGLDPQDYAVGVPQSLEGLSETGRLSALARFETTLSARVLRYMRDARLGRIDPNRISGYHDFEAEPFDAGAMLEELASTGDLEALLERQHPQNDFYRALRAELEMQRARQENDIVVAADTFVRPGQSNAEFPKILKLIEQREELVLSPEEEEILSRNAASETYLQELVPVVKAAQRSAGLQDDGIVGPRTVRELAGLSRSARIGMLEASLERIRWLPSDLGDRYVFLNAPSFTAAYFEDGEEKLSMRAIYGSKATQTYFFQDRIAYVEFHPYWGVPRSILVNKYLRKLISDPSYLDRNGFEVTDRSGRTIPSSAIDWGAYGANIPFDVRQLPGSGNALGELKIMFPNKHAIYMHDTPEKHLFERDNRALSNGCVRLQDPRAMAAAVLGWTREQVAARLQGPHSRENLEVEVPVYVGYFTAWPTAGGEVAYHGDVYDRDARISAAIEKVRALRNTGA